MAGWFKAGGFNFPTSTGSLAITGLPGEPQGIIFFGGNQNTLDSLLHPAAPGLFFGMAWRDVDTGNVDYQTQCWTTYGLRWRPRPICCLSTGTTILFEASVVAFNANGFTLTISDAAPAGHRVHYLAWGGFNGSEGKTMGGTSGGQVFNFASLGYRPLSALMFDMFSSGASRDSSAANAIYFTMGTANFREDYAAGSPFTPGNNATAITMRAQAGVAEGFTQQYFSILNDAITASVASGVAGTWATNIDHLRPNPAYTSDGLRATLFGHPNRAQLVWWNCEGSVHQVDTPAVAAVNEYTALSNVGRVQAALFFGTTGFGSEEELGVNVAYVFGVLTEDYQAVVAFDTGRGNAPANGTKSYYQSEQACFINGLSPGGGVRVASGEIVGNKVRLTGEIASNPSHGGSFMQVWGPEVPAVWVPQIYRRRAFGV
jgi:hypothetical protein